MIIKGSIKQSTPPTRVFTYLHLNKDKSVVYDLKKTTKNRGKVATKNINNVEYFLANPAWFSRKQLLVSFNLLQPL